MNQFAAIAKNTYLQAVRQPVYGIILLLTLGGMAMAPFLTGWTLDDDDKMLRDIGLSTLLIQGLFLACFVASSVVDSEIEAKTALTVIAKPVSRVVFILGKYFGVLCALVTAHYLTGIVLFMAMRHGVLQTARDTSDPTVLILGPGVMLLVMVAAGLMNYVYERRFLPTVLVLSVPCLTAGAVILLVIDRDFGIKSFKTTQSIPSLVPSALPAGALRGIVEFEPGEGQSYVSGHHGELVRRNWKGPIGDDDRAYLMSLSEDLQWKKNIRFLVDATRALEGFEIVKAAILILGAVALLGSIAVAVSTRFGIVPTFLVNILVVCAGLAADQILKPIAEVKTWAAVAYRFIPNFQCFWMVDALNENRIIPLGYIASSAGYAFLYVVAVLLFAMAMFETREVG